MDGLKERPNVGVKSMMPSRRSWCLQCHPRESSGEAVMMHVAFLAISRGSPNFTPFVPFPLKDFVKNACRHRLVIAIEDTSFILE
jgi:hypothetical protein